MIKLQEFEKKTTGIHGFNCFDITHRVKDLDYKGTDAVDDMDRAILI